MSDVKAIYNTYKSLNLEGFYEIRSILSQIDNIQFNVCFEIILLR